MSKKLVYIANYVHGSDAQHFFHIMALLRNLEESCGWDIRLLSEKGGSGMQIVEGKQVHYLSRSSRLLRIWNLAAQLVRCRLAGYRLVFVRISKPAAIVSSLVGRLLGIKVLYWQSGAVDDWNRAQPWRKRFLDHLVQTVTSRVVHRFVTGPESMLQYYERVLGVPGRKLLLLYNDVDLQRFRPDVSKKEEAQGLNILCVHRFSRLRETTLYFPHIIEALANVARSGVQANLVLIGDGDEVRELQDIAQGSRQLVDVQFLGAVPNARIQEYYARADIFIMPSYREGFPRVMIEAMAMGLPAVATDAGGTRDIVGPLQQEWIVSRDDPQAFATKLAALAQDAELRRRMGAENVRHVQRYSTPAVAQMYDRALASML